MTCHVLSRCYGTPPGRTPTSRLSYSGDVDDALNAAITTLQVGFDAAARTDWARSQNFSAVGRITFGDEEGAVLAAVLYVAAQDLKHLCALTDQFAITSKGGDASGARFDGV